MYLPYAVSVTALPYLGGWLHEQASSAEATAGAQWATSTDH